MLNFLRQFLQAAKPYLIKYLQTAAFKAAAKLIWKTATPTGLKAWVIKVLVKKLLFDKAITPMVEAAFRELGYQVERGKGKLLVKRLRKAKDENDQTTYDNTMDDILG